MRSRVQELTERVADGDNIHEAISDYLAMLSQFTPAAKDFAAVLGKEALDKSAAVAVGKSFEIPDLVATGVGKTLDKTFKKIGKLPAKGVTRLAQIVTGDKTKKIAKKASQIRREVAAIGMPLHVAKAHESNIRGIIKDLSKGRINKRDALDLLDAALRSIEAEKMAKNLPPYASPVTAVQSF